MSEWSSGKQHSQDSSQQTVWPLTWLGSTRAEERPLVLAAKQPAMCVYKCVCVDILFLESVIVFHQADKCLCICLWACSHVTVLQRGRLAAWAWTRHASFIHLTSDKAEALLVMMWLLLPIMPRCRPGRKTVRYVLFVSHRLSAETNTLLLFYEAFLHYWDTSWQTRGTSFTKLHSSLKCDFIILSCQRWKCSCAFLLWVMGLWY